MALGPNLDEKGNQKLLRQAKETHRNPPSPPSWDATDPFTHVRGKAASTLSSSWLERVCRPVFAICGLPGETQIETNQETKPFKASQTHRSPPSPPNARALLRRYLDPSLLRKAILMKHQNKGQKKTREFSARRFPSRGWRRGTTSASPRASASKGSVGASWRPRPGAQWSVAGLGPVGPLKRSTEKGSRPNMVFLVGQEPCCLMVFGFCGGMLGKLAQF